MLLGGKDVREQQIAASSSANQLSVLDKRYHVEVYQGLAEAFPVV